MTTQTIALAGGGLLMLLVLVALRRRRSGAGTKVVAADESDHRPTPILADPGRMSAAGSPADAHMGPPAPEPMDWPPFPPTAKESEVLAEVQAEVPVEAHAMVVEPPPRRAPVQQPAWAVGEIVTEPGWPMPGELETGWQPAMPGSLTGNGHSAEREVAVPSPSSSDGMLATTLSGFDPAAGWGDEDDHAATGEMPLLSQGSDPDPDTDPVAEAGESQWDEPMEMAAPDAPPLEWMPAQPEEARPFTAERAAEAHAEPEVAEPVAEDPFVAEAEVPEYAFEIPALAPEPDRPEPGAEDPFVAPEVEVPEYAFDVPEAEMAEYALDAPEVDLHEVVGFELPALSTFPMPAVTQEPEVVAHELDAPEVPSAASDEAPIAWWDVPDPEPAILAAPFGGSSGRFALGGFALQPGHEALTGVTFRAPLAVAPATWAVGSGDSTGPGTLVLELDGAINCAADALAVVTDSGFAPTTDGFTVRVAAQASGPFAASGTFRVI